MIFFGHLGLTTEAIKAYEVILHKDNKLSGKEVFVDYRYVLIGSILPDIIDKPIGAGVFRSVFHNSRIFGHTLIFSLVLILIGIYMLNRNGKNNILFLGIASSIHLVLDSMWLYPNILLWPYLGWKFPARPEGNWVNSDIVRLITDPTYYLPELIGFAIIAYFFIRLFRRRQIKCFLNKGKL